MLGIMTRAAMALKAARNRAAAKADSELGLDNLLVIIIGVAVVAVAAVILVPIISGLINNSSGKLNNVQGNLPSAP